MHSISKVLYIIVSTASFWISFTPPHLPPTKDEKAESITLEVLLKHRPILFMIKGFFSSIALAETAILIARYVPDHPDSHLVLSHLIFPGGAAERICTTLPSIIGASMATIGGLIRHRCYRVMGRMFTFEMSIRRDHKLVTSGPYGVVRHPGYTGILLVVSGMLLLHASEGSWLRESGVLKITVMKMFSGLVCGLVTAVIYGLLRRMSKEDKALYQLAGKEWEDWAKRVPYRLFPLIC
ncbi:hypothetical protein Ac2012v2_006066 [Leucoagaricus gongylophorus]